MMKSNKEFGVIGLGIFGKSVVETLLKYEADVIAVDSDEEKIKKIAEKVDHACRIDTTDEEALKGVGMCDVDHVIVCVGEDVEGCIMTVMALKNIGVKNITVKSGSDKLTEVLENLGIKDIIKPEKEVGVMVAKRLLHTLISDFISIDEDHSLVQMKIEKEELLNVELASLDLREKFGINVVGITRDGKFFIPNAHTCLQKDDIVSFIGEDKNISKLEKYLKD